MKTQSRVGHLSRPDALLIDIDDTLYDYDTCHRAGLVAMRELLSEELDIRAKTFEDAYGRARAEIQARLGKTASSHSRLLYASRLLELLGMRTQPATALRLEAAYWRSFLTVCEPFSGVEEFFLEFRLQGIPICVVTDLTMAIQYRKLLHLRFADIVDWVVTSEEVPGDKPSHHPYRLAMQKLELPTTATVWMVGDNAADVRDIKAVIPATTLLKLNGKNDELAADADVTFRDFRALLDLIRPILATKS